MTRLNGESHFGPQSDYQYGTDVVGTIGSVFPIQVVPKNYPPAPPPRPWVYRWMRRDPVIALARAITLAPMLSTPWSVEVADDSVPELWSDWVMERYEPMRNRLIKQLFFGVDFGNRVLERVRYVDDEGYVTTKAFKPLRPELTEIQRDPDTGEFVGVKQGDRFAAADDVILYSHAVEDDDYRGESRMENIRESAWWPSVCLAQNMARLENSKVVGFIPLWYYDPRPGRDANNQVIDPGKEVQKGLSMLSRAEGIAIPNNMPDADATSTAAERESAAKSSRNFIDVKDFGNAAPAVVALLERAKYLDSNKMRGYFKPERMALEGTFGTKAEAAEHADIGEADSDHLNQEFVEEVINPQSVDRDLRDNFAAPAGSVTLRVAPIRDADKAFARELFKILLANPSAMDVMVMAMDRDSLMDLAGVPKNERVIDFDKLEEELQSQQEDAKVTDPQKELLDKGLQAVRDTKDPENEPVKASESAGRRPGVLRGRIGCGPRSRSRG
jgi:hypothetical protein